MYRYSSNDDIFSFTSLEDGLWGGFEFSAYQNPFFIRAENLWTNTETFEITLSSAHIDEADLPDMGGCGCCDCGEKMITDMLDFGTLLQKPEGPIFMDSVPGDSSTTASVSIGGNISGTRETNGDADWFTVDLVEGTTYSFFMIRSGADPHDDPRLRLIDTDGTTEIINNDDYDSDGDGDGDNQNSGFTFTATSTGTFFLSAEGWQANSLGDYTIYANEGTDRPDFTLDQAAFFLTDQFSAPSQWGSTSLTYDISALPAAVQALAIAAMNLWADASGLSFTAATGSGADITFQDTEGGAFASTSRTGSTITSATVNVSQADWIDTYGTDINSYSFQTYIHEVGHALGLGHGGPYNGGADYANDRLYNQDAWNYSVMSYFDQTEAGNGTARLVLGLQIVDILAIQDLYGANASGTRGGDTVYGFNSNAGGNFDFEAWQTQGIRPPSLAIYDTGGTDTLDMSGYSAHQTISLVEETFSSVGDNTNTGGDLTDALVNLISIARGAVIENAVGGSGNDVMTGNAASNVLEGGEGNDTIDGGAGTDYAVYATGVLADYTVTDNGDGTTTVTHSTYGTDTLSNVEFLRINGVDHEINASGPINGTGAGETLTGTADADVINGLGGDDTLAGLGGADALDGGSGTDTADYSASASAVVVKLWNGTGEFGDAEGDTLTSIENLLGSDHEDLLIGDVNVNHLNGGAGNDQIFGLGGDDVLTGGTGDDSLDGGDGIDYANYTSGVLADYTITYNGDGTITVQHGTFGTDTLTDVEFLRIDGVNHSLAQGGTQDGTPGADTLTGTAFVDQLNGLAGDDTLAGLGGADALDGGAGTDTADYSASASAVVVKLWNGTGEFGDAQGDTLTSIENLIGSDHADVLIGDINANNLDGGASNDSLYGLAGDDVLTGGTGDDLVDGGDGTDYANYATGVLADYTLTYNGDGTITVTHSTFGTDTLNDVEFIRIDGVNHSLAQGGTQNGTAGPDTLTGTDFVDQLNGLGGDDVLAGLGDADALDGGDGVDTADYSASASGVLVRLFNGTGEFGDAQGDTLTSIENLIGSGSADTLIGSNDTANELSGGAGNDGLYGLSGDDNLIGGAGADTLDGGTGTDTADYSASAAGVLVRLFNGTGTGGDSEGDTLVSIENLIGSNASDTLIGSNDTANQLSGGNGNDGLYGLSGDDVLIGGAGADTLDGGDGFDGADYSESSAAVTVKLWNGTGVGGDAEGDTLTSIEALRGSAFGDLLIGSNATADALFGQGGNDSLYGLDGDDGINGGAGADFIDGGAGTDTVDYSTSSAGVTIKLWEGTGAGGEAQGDTLVSIEQVIGSGFADLLIGSNAQTDVLFGAAGNDAIYGLDGNDSLIGGAGADTIDGGAGTDVASYSSSTAAVTVKLWNGTGAGGDAEGDILTNIEGLQGSMFGDLLIGRNSETDFFFGLGGDDSIYALSGNDVLDGSGGNDYLDGGTGADTFIFSGTFGNDQVAGFVAAAGEKIDISAITDVSDFADLTANHLSMDGGNTVITTSSGTITLIGVDMNDLVAADFNFAPTAAEQDSFEFNDMDTVSQNTGDLDDFSSESNPLSLAANMDGFADMSGMDALNTMTDYLEYHDIDFTAWDLA